MLFERKKVQTRKNANNKIECSNAVILNRRLRIQELSDSFQKITDK